MVDYRSKLGINFELSPMQIKILQSESDTIVRAIPGSGKTTILTLKIKDLLYNNPQINNVCCISYTNVNVEDLKESCQKLLNDDHMAKIDFLTFHGFCLKYILRPFGYLYRSNKGLRYFTKIFDYREHSQFLIEYLKAKNISIDDINQITEKEKIYYNFVNRNGWKPTSNTLSNATVIAYLNFLNENRLTDFNLINLLSLFIIEEHQHVRLAVNKAIQWVFIDEFQDVSEIQCEIVKKLRSSRTPEGTKWFLVGDPNQSIYGFAGANPKSMYDMKRFFDAYLTNNETSEIKLDKTHRCTDNVFSFAKENYNEYLNKIINSDAFDRLNNSELREYLSDLRIDPQLSGNNKEGQVKIRNTIKAVQEVVNLKINELMNDEVCCIGIYSFNSIDVYREFKQHNGVEPEKDYQIYSEIYKDYEDKYGFKYFSTFVRYLTVKDDFLNNRIDYQASLNAYMFYLEQVLIDKIEDEALINLKLLDITVDSLEIKHKLDPEQNLFDAFVEYSNRLAKSIDKHMKDEKGYENMFKQLKPDDKHPQIQLLQQPQINGFIEYHRTRKKKEITFDVKYIHKIKGLEYEQVIVQKIESLPHKTNNSIHAAISGYSNTSITTDEVYNYIQEMNKLYVMLTRSKKNLYVIIDSNKAPRMLSKTLLTKYSIYQGSQAN